MSITKTIDKGGNNMTRKDYMLLAGALSQAVNLSSGGDHTRGTYHTIACIADALSADNKAFDTELFIANIAADVRVRHQDDNELDRCIRVLERAGYEVQVKMPDMEG